jgi:hypothetical protein
MIGWWKEALNLDLFELFQTIEVRDMAMNPKVYGNGSQQKKGPTTSVSRSAETIVLLHQ